MNMGVGNSADKAGDEGTHLLIPILFARAENVQ